MKVEKKELPRSQVELDVELSVEEFTPYIEKGAKKISLEVKIDGFRPGNIPLEVLKQKVGEMNILEEAARIAINKTIEQVVKEHIIGDPVGSPKVDITKLAPGNALGYKVTLSFLPEIKLGTYKNLGLKKKEVKLEDGELEKALESIREMRVKEVIADRETRDNDKVMIDIQMFLDNVPVEGGQGKDTVIIFGKEYIIPGFDKKLVGSKKGEIKEFSLPYPNDHHMKNLAGKMVDFKVTIKEVYERQMPELDDEFAKGFGLKKISELKENMQTGLKNEKMKQAEQVIEKEMIDKIINTSKFGDIPEVLIHNETHNMIHELEHTIEEQGGKFEDYLSSIGKNESQLTLDLMPDAIKRVKASLLIREIAKVEKIEADAEELEKHIFEMKKYHKNNQSDDSVEALKRLDSQEYRSYVQNVLASKKIVETLKQWNIEK